MQRYVHILRALQQATPKDRKRILKNTPKGFIQAIIKLSRHFLKGKTKLSPAVYRIVYKKRAQLRKLATCKGKSGLCKARKELNQRGGIFPLIPLLAAAAPFIGKALLGIGASAAASVAGSAISKAINKR